MSLAGKKALITGAGTGIGREIGLEFARQGADVIFHYSHSSEGAVSAVEAASALGGKAHSIGADFLDLAQVETLVKLSIDFLGGLDCLVNNAGITFTKPFVDISTDQLDTLLNVNVRAPFVITQHAVRHMLESGGGAVCNISSIHGLQGGPDYSAYAATKGAILACTRALAVELAHKGVRVNAIAPGWVTVENYAKAIPDYDPEQERADASRMIPVSRPGTPLDIAKLAAFLCSDDASFIVGETIVADGGTTALTSLKADFRSSTSARWGIGYVPGA